LGAAGPGLGDVSERCGSVDRHNDVRELGSQFWDAQEGAPEYQRPRPPGGGWAYRNQRGSDLHRRCSDTSRNLRAARHRAR